MQQTKWSEDKDREMGQKKERVVQIQRLEDRLELLTDFMTILLHEIPGRDFVCGWTLCYIILF